VPEYRHWASVVILAASDVVAFVLAALLFRVGRATPEIVFLPGRLADQTPVDIFFILGFLFILVRYICGDYSRRGLFWDSTRATTVGLIIASLPCFLILVALPGQYSSSASIASWIFLLFAVPCLRQLARVAMTYAGIWRLPAALIASGPRAYDIYAALNNTISLGYDIRWLALDEADREPRENLKRLKQIFLTDPGEIAAKLAADGCAQVVIATDDMQSTAFADLIQRLMERGISVAFIPSFLRLPLVRVTTSYFFGHDILLFQVRNSLWRAPHRFIKRSFDIVGSIALLLLFLPVLITISIAIKRYDGGKVSYAQRRVGRYGRQFDCLKFRTMAEDADSRRARWAKEEPELYAEFLKTYKLRDDPRVTKPGKWLRRTSLDELPQLLNVLRGEMSLVGPRPIPEQQLLDHYGQAAQLYMQVRPGLTGLWQISGRNETTLEERVVYDEWYILNWSFWYDIVILIQTAWIIVSGRGAF
jgi:Undecaprenyl-phosphate galactose phosphotransferase WbaP